MSVSHHHRDYPRLREAAKDRTELEEQLSMAREDVRRGIEQVRKQREIVQALERGGHDAAQAQKALKTFEDSLFTLMADRGQLVRELEGAKNRPTE
jgi:hypothetical protein